MQVYTLSKQKLLIAILALAVLAVVLIVSVTGCRGGRAQTLADNAERVAYLQGLGWVVGSEPVKSHRVKIPAEMNEVLARYNQVQLQQGFDLSDDLGRSAERYVYELKNYPDAPGPVYATLIVADGTLIAADLSCSEEGGFVRPLTEGA